MQICLTIPVGLNAKFRTQIDNPGIWGRDRKASPDFGDIGIHPAIVHAKFRRGRQFKFCGRLDHQFHPIIHLNAGNPLQQGHRHQRLDTSLRPGHTHTFGPLHIHRIHQCRRLNTGIRMEVYVGHHQQQSRSQRNNRSQRQAVDSMPDRNNPAAVGNDFCGFVRGFVLRNSGGVFLLPAQFPP